MTGRDRMALIAAAMPFAATCAGHRVAPVEPDAVTAPAIGAEDIVLDGEALVGRVELESVSDAPLVQVLLAGLERMATSRVPEFGDAMEVSGRAPLEDARRIVATGRGLDENSSLFALAVEYGQRVDWFEDVVRAFHGGKLDQGVLVENDEGVQVGILSDDSSLDWGISPPAALCAVRFTDRLVAWVAAPRAMDCHAWAGWVVARGGGDEALLEMLGRAPEVRDGPAPLAAYVAGDRMETLCCAPFGLANLAVGVRDMWMSVDPRAPLVVRASIEYEEAARAAQDRDRLASFLDGVSPTISAWVPGLATALDAMEIGLVDARLDLAIEIDEETVRKIADILSAFM